MVDRLPGTKDTAYTNFFDMTVRVVKDRVVILACLDSRHARMVVNQAAWRLGVPWIDAGIDADGLLARVRVFVPRRDAPCLECGWDQPDYDVLEQSYPCAAAAAPASTRGSSALGALAASLQAIECDKLLAGDSPSALIDRDLLLDARNHKHYVTAYRHNPACRMPDHDGWRIAPLAARSARTTLADLLALGSTLAGADERLTVGVAGQRIATELRCAACDVAVPTFELDRRVGAARRRCPRCGGPLLIPGFGLHDAALASAVPADAVDLELSAVGCRAGDVITLGTSALEAHFELGGRS